MTLTKAEAALLGLLSEKSMYPYQIEEQVKAHDMRLWTELSMSAIYKLLRKLENDGLVSRINEISPENRLRKLYHVTDKGKDALMSKLVVLLSHPEHVRWPVDIGIYNCDLLPMETVYIALSAYRKALLEKVGAYEDLLEGMKQSGCPPHRLGMTIRPVHLLKAEIHWVDEFMLQLQTGGIF